MKIIERLVIGSLLLCSVALAQEPNSYSYSGKWDATMVNNKGETRRGTVTLTDKDGIWDINWLSARNPCAGMRSPIVIQRASADELVFEIGRSKVLRGCKDNIVTLKRVSETTLQGELDDGRKLTLVRK
jgi:hypothetical protein